MIMHIRRWTECQWGAPGQTALCAATAGSAEQHCHTDTTFSKQGSSYGASPFTGSATYNHVQPQVAMQYSWNIITVSAQEEQILGGITSPLCSR